MITEISIDTTYSGLSFDGYLIGPSLFAKCIIENNSGENYYFDFNSYSFFLIYSYKDTTYKKELSYWSSVEIEKAAKQKIFCFKQKGKISLYIMGSAVFNKSLLQDKSKTSILNEIKNISNFRIKYENYSKETTLVKDTCGISISTLISEPFKTSELIIRK